MEQGTKKQNSIMTVDTLFLRMKRCLFPIMVFFSVTLMTLLIVLIIEKYLDVPKNLDLSIILYTAFLIISCISLSIQLCMLWKTKRRKNKYSFDEEYVQEYIRAVGTYLGADAEEKLSLYRSVSANIYTHIPEKYWTLIDRIDAQVSINNKEAAWDELKFFARFLVTNEEK